MIKLLVSLLVVGSTVIVANGADITPPTITSDVCLACHDGSRGPEVPLRDGHPVQIQYDNVQRFSTAFLKPSFSPSGRGATIQADMLLAGYVECTSCHFTHDEETDTRYRLKTDEEGTRTLCLACHDPQ